MNNDGTLEECEIWVCTLRTENVWRDENCPNYGRLSCFDGECPFIWRPCVNGWNCADIIHYTEAYMAVMDTNGDNAVTNMDMVD